MLLPLAPLQSFDLIEGQLQTARFRATPYSLSPSFVFDPSGTQIPIPNATVQAQNLFDNKRASDHSYQFSKAYVAGKTNVTLRMRLAAPGVTELLLLAAEVP